MELLQLRIGYGSGKLGKRKHTSNTLRIDDQTLVERLTNGLVATRNTTFRENDLVHLNVATSKHTRTGQEVEVPHALELSVAGPAVLVFDRVPILIKVVIPRLQCRVVIGPDVVNILDQEQVIRGSVVRVGTVSQLKLNDCDRTSREKKRDDSINHIQEYNTEKITY